MVSPLEFKDILKELPKQVAEKWILLKMKVCPFCLKNNMTTYYNCDIHNYSYSNWYIGMLRFALNIPDSEKNIFKIQFWQEYLNAKNGVENEKK